MERQVSKASPVGLEKQRGPAGEVLQQLFKEAKGTGRGEREAQGLRDSLTCGEEACQRAENSSQEGNEADLGPLEHI